MGVKLMQGNEISDLRSRNTVFQKILQKKLSDAYNHIAEAEKLSNRAHKYLKNLPETKSFIKVLPIVNDMSEKICEQFVAERKSEKRDDGKKNSNKGIDWDVQLRSRMRGIR